MFVVCRNCGEVEAVIIPRHNGPHEADLRCPVCNYHLGFKAKEKNVGKQTRRGTPTPDELGIELCQLCLRHKDSLGAGWLETHHIDDEPDNNDRSNLLVVCIACHKLITWLRTYVNNHLKTPADEGGYIR